MSADTENRMEQRFYRLVGELFTGRPVEGRSGYVNLMRIKAQYYQHVMRPSLEREVAQCTADFPQFREELYEKLYTFLRRYIHEETGSLGLFFTPYHESVYERVYTDDRDMMLFWKTARLYYIKTDMMFRNMDVDVDGYRLRFDTSQVEHKRSNEKRKLCYSVASIGEKCVTLSVSYVESGGSGSDLSGLVEELRRHGIALSEQQVEDAIRKFERQAKVDYFLCKDARRFLREQFDLWLWQYLLGAPGDMPDSEFSELRVKQLQALKQVAYRVIDLIAQFEDELVRIWNKPKFVLHSSYVITLDRIWARCPEMVRRLIQHPGMVDQVAEWRQLGMVGHEFRAEQVVRQASLIEELHPRYQFLPLDTRYFKDLELEVVGLFDHLDQQLNGWLIRSENYQALNTILPRWRGRVRCIYIDPPFNKEQEADYEYIVNYRDSTWASMLWDRLSLARQFLSPDGCIFVRCDYNGNHIVRHIMDTLFGRDCFQNELVVGRFKKPSDRVATITESLFLYAVNSGMVKLNRLKRPRQCTFCKQPIQPRWHLMLSSGEGKTPITLDGVTFYPPRGQHWKYSQEAVDRMAKSGRIRIDTSKRYTDIHGNRTTGMIEYLEDEEQLVDSNWTDIPGYEYAPDFSTTNAEELLKRAILLGSDQGDVVMDFFLGSGTTIAVAHKLGRRWIGIEMGEQFNEHILPRMKRVLFYDGSGISKDEDVKSVYARDKAGGMFKYYELESYEMTLRHCTRSTDSLPDMEIRPFQLDPKLLHMVYIDANDEAVRVDPESVRQLGVDLAESICNVHGLRLRRLLPDGFETEQEQTLRYDDSIVAELMKPMIWW